MVHKVSSSSLFVLQTPVLPPTITDQIRLWELERDRLQFTEGEWAWHLFQYALVLICCSYQHLIHIYSHYLSVWRLWLTDTRWPRSVDWSSCCLLLCEGLYTVMEQRSIDFSSPVLCSWCPCLSQECSITSFSPRLTLRCCEIELRWDFVS